MVFLSVSPVDFSFSFSLLFFTSAFTVEESSITDTPAPAATATMPIEALTDTFSVWLLPR